MAKKREVKPFDLKDTMLYERKKIDDTQKKPRNHKKIAAIVIASLLIVLIGIPWLIVTIIKSNSESIVNDGRPKSTYSELLSDVKATEKSTKLHSMKNPDLKDKAAVEALISELQISDELGAYAVEIQSEQKPYEITLKFELSHNVPADGYDMWEQTMIKYSCAILSLANNVAKVNWEFPGMTGEKYFTRGDAEKLYNLGVTAVTFAKSPESVQLMLTQLGIDIY